MKLLPALLAALAVAGCVAANVPPPTLEMAGGRAATLDSLQRGRTLYVNKCSGCHSLHSVEDYADAEWEYHVEEMVALGKVKLDSAEQSLILLYLGTANGRD